MVQQRRWDEMVTLLRPEWLNDFQNVQAAAQVENLQLVIRNFRPYATWYGDLIVFRDSQLVEISMMIDGPSWVQAEVWARPFASFPPTVDDRIMPYESFTLAPPDLTVRVTDFEGWVIEFPADTVLRFWLAIEMEGNESGFDSTTCVTISLKLEPWTPGPV